MNTKTLPTHGEAKTALDNLLNDFADSRQINESDIQTAFTGIENSLNVRDYLLGGLGLTFTDFTDRMTFLSLFSVAGESANIEAIRGAYQYEEGLTVAALESLTKAHDLDPEHALTRLIFQVIKSGWAVNAFEQMRNELHPKVIEKLSELSGDKVGK